MIWRKEPISNWPNKAVIPAKWRPVPWLGKAYIAGVGFSRSRGSVSSSRHINDLVPLDSEETHSMPDDGYDNLTAAQCRTFAERNKARAKQPGISIKRATVLMNIARTYSGLASQLEILAGDKGEM